MIRKQLFWACVLFLSQTYNMLSFLFLHLIFNVLLVTDLQASCLLSIHDKCSIPEIQLAPFKTHFLSCANKGY